MSLFRDDITTVEVGVGVICKVIGRRHEYIICSGLEKDTVSLVSAGNWQVCSTVKVHNIHHLSRREFLELVHFTMTNIDDWKFLDKSARLAE